MINSLDEGTEIDELAPQEPQLAHCTDLSLCVWRIW